MSMTQNTRSVAVLVVEDEPLLRLLTVESLTSSGFSVLEAGNADAALAMIEEHPEITVLFSDIDMPGSMDGIALARVVRDRWPPIRLLLTSGHTAPARGELPPDARFFGKPTKFDEIEHLLRGWMA